MSDDISIPAPTYRVPRHRGMDPATRRLALIAAGIGGALVVIVGGWSLLGGGPHTVPVIAPQPGPVRVKPAHPGGLQVQGLGNDIFSGRGDGTVAKLAPPPEVPDPQALRVPPMPVPAPAPAPVATRAAAPTRMPLAPAAQPASVPASRPAPVAASNRPAARSPATQPAAQARARTLAAQPAAPVQQQAVAGGAQVQLAALSTEAAAKSEWRDLTRRVPGLLSGRQPVFSQKTIGGHVFWQVRAGGFANRTDAAEFCQRVRARGLACYLPSS